MELIYYWRFIRQWSVLIVVGTVLSALVSYAVVHVRQRNAVTTYGSTSSVVVHYVTPFGTPFNPTLSPQEETVGLRQVAVSPATVAAVARQYHVQLNQVTAVTATVDSDTTAIQIGVVGRTPEAVSTVANGLAAYVARQESQKIANEAKVLQDGIAPDVAAARKRWLTAQIHYNTVSGQTGNRPSPILAQLQAQLTIVQQEYLTLLNQFEALSLNALPAATARQDQQYQSVSHVGSLLGTVLPATVLGFCLSVGLAAILDYLKALSTPRGLPASGLRPAAPARETSASAGGTAHEADEAASR